MGRTTEMEHFSPDETDKRAYQHHVRVRQEVSPLQRLHDVLLGFGRRRRDVCPRVVREALAAAHRSAPKELVVRTAWHAWRASGAPDPLVLGCGHRISALRLTSDGGHECEECVKRAASEALTSV